MPGGRRGCNVFLGGSSSFSPCDSGVSVAVRKQTGTMGFTQPHSPPAETTMEVCSLLRKQGEGRGADGGREGFPSVVGVQKIQIATS